MSYFTTGERRGTILLIIIIAIIILAMAIHSGLFHDYANSSSAAPTYIQYTDTVTTDIPDTDSIKGIKSKTRKTKKKTTESHKRQSGPSSRDYLSEPV